jgi:hypothetical protein
MGVEGVEEVRSQNGGDVGVQESADFFPSASGLPPETVTTGQNSRWSPYSGNY